jgi:signal transduction histidine kinase
MTLRIRIVAGLGAVAAVAVATVALALSLPAAQPPIRPAPAPGTGLEVHHAGTWRAVATFTVDGVPVPAEGRLGVEEPDLLDSWAAYDAVLADVGALTAAARAGTLSAELADGPSIPVAAGEREPGDLPFAFWLQLVCGTLAAVLCVLVWSPRPRELPVALFALTGAGYMVSALAASIYSTRALLIDGELFGALSLINQGGALVFCAALTGLLWNYPLRLGGVRLVLGAFLAAGAALVATGFQLTETIGTSLHLWIVGIFAVGIAGSVRQWQHTSSDAQGRAALRWFLLSIYAGTAIFTLMALLPSILGVEVLVSQAWLLATFLPMYVGMALGVLRYRLFDLERWWFYIWAWALGGLAIVLVDLSLVTVLTTAETTTLAIATAIVGWLYFPVRQWAWQRFVRRSSGVLDDWLAVALPPMLSVREEQELLPALRRTLTSVFRPLSTRLVAQRTEVIEIADEGQVLRVPLLGTRQAVALEHAQGCARLFTRSDVATAQRVLALYGVMLRALRAKGEGASAERERIRKDIHDDLGAKLLTLLHRAVPDDQALVREAIRDLRELLRALEAEPIPLAAALDQWRGEYEQRCRDAEVALAWREDGVPDAVDLAPRTHHHVTRILREALSNALRHADPLQVHVALSPGGGRLEVTVANDGRLPEDGAFVPGRGTQIMRQRAESLDGRVDWRREGEHWSVTVSLPLTGDNVVEASDRALLDGLDEPPGAPLPAPA